MGKATKQPAQTAEKAATARALKKLAELDRKFGKVDQGLAQLPTAATASLPATAPRKEPKPANDLTIHADESETDSQALARSIIHPVTGAMIAVRRFKPLLEKVALKDIADELSKHVLDVRANNMNRPEAILVCQAQTLDIMFGELALRAAHHMGSSTDKMEAYMRQALRVQSQCRATIETLAEIKNPRTPTFVKQQNVANQQQVNNGVPAPVSPAHGQEKTIVSNEILEGQQHGERMDTRTAGTAGGGDPQVEAVEEGQRAEDAVRKSNQQPKRAATRSTIG